MNCAECGLPMTEYVHVYHCTSCGDYIDKRKPPRMPMMRAQRQDWTNFCIDNNAKYVEMQIDAMVRHLKATPALDWVWLSTHDAFGHHNGGAVIR